MILISFYPLILFLFLNIVVMVVIIIIAKILSLLIRIDHFRLRNLYWRRTLRILVIECK